MKARPTRTDFLTELALVLLGAHVLLLAIFRRYSLEGAGIPLTATNPNLALVLCFLLLAFRAWRNRSRADEKLTRRERLKPGNWCVGLGAAGLIVASCFLFVFSLFHHYGGRLGGDGVINFIYVRSWVIDRDFDLTNEFEDFVPAKFQIIAAAARANGLSPEPSNEPGPALFWTPAYVATHVLVLGARWLGADIAADGYSYPYINAVCVSGFLWGFVAVLIAYHVSCRYFDARLAAVSVCILWLSSTLYWYTVVEPSMPHATGAAAVSIFLFLWLSLRESPSGLKWMTLGLAGGLVVSMQRYNAFYFLAPLLTLGGWLLPRLGSLERKDLRSMGLGVGVILAVIATASPMLLSNLSSGDGSLLRIGVSTFRHWKSPKIIEFLFSSNHGLFAWTPVACLGVLGLFLLFKKDRHLAATLLVTLAAGIYLLSSTWDWYAGFAFGSRRLTEAFLIFALGFCASAELFSKKPQILGAAALALLVAWNVLLAGQVKRGEVPMMGTFAFSDAASRAVKRVYEVVGHPSSVPASWPFGWKYGVSPEQFDPTFGHRDYHNVNVDVGSSGDRYFLGHGWSAPEQMADGSSFRWSLGRESTWLVPLFGSFDYQLRLKGEPSRHPDGRRQTVSITVNGKRAATITLAEGWQSLEARVPASFWRKGLNEIQLLYGWTVEAGSVYGGSDDRQIALRLAGLELRIVQ